VYGTRAPQDGRTSHSWNSGEAGQACGQFGAAATATAASSFSADVADRGKARYRSLIASWLCNWDRQAEPHLQRPLTVPLIKS
ncbi:MAG: hypothetical protein WCB11_09665, partial [Terriglobales bacterium]